MVATDSSRTLGSLVPQLSTPQREDENTHGAAASTQSDGVAPSSLLAVGAGGPTSRSPRDANGLETPQSAVSKGDRVLSETEQALCRIWREVLGVAHVDVDDEFIDMGGSSLAALQTIGRV